MPTQHPTHCSLPHQLLLPLDLPKQPVLIPRSLDLVQFSPQRVWNTLTDEQQRHLRHQLIQILQEVVRHANQDR